MKKWAIWAAAMAAALVVCAQGAVGQTAGAMRRDRIQAVDGRAMGGQTIVACAYNASNYALVGTVWTYTGPVPCTPPITMYADPALQDAITPPLLTDSQGNYAYAEAAGNYTECVTGPNVTGSCWLASVGGTSGGGSSVFVNGAPVASPNFNGTTPAAPSGYTNFVLQASGANVSAYVPSPFLVPQLGSASSPVQGFFSMIDYAGSPFGFFAGNGAALPAPSGVYTTGWGFPGPNNLPQQWNPSALAWRDQADMGGAPSSYTSMDLICAGANYGDLVDCGSSPGTGLSGMTVGQVPLAASATTVTSSKALAGSGAAIATEPTTTTSGDCVKYADASGTLADSGSACGSSGSPGYTTITLTSNYTNASDTSFTNVSDGTNTMQFTASANTSYRMECHLYYAASTTSGGIQVAFTGPTSPTVLNYSGLFGTYESASTPEYASTFQAGNAYGSGNAIGYTTHSSTALFPATLDLSLQNGSTSGTVNLIAADIAGSDTLTIHAGSYCRVYTQ